MFFNRLKKINAKSFEGGLLLLAGLMAVLLANSPYQQVYFNQLSTSYRNTLFSYSYSFTVLDFIDNGLMVLFFLLIGLELKREIVIGELRGLKKQILPCAAAVGGMLMPIVIFTCFNFHDATAMRGCGIPIATDIAFSLAILSLLGSRIPHSLKIFLTALAIIDDLGAIIFIALFYQHGIHWTPLIFVMIILCILLLLNSCFIKKIWLYLLFGTILWFCFLFSGVHATIAGVLAAITIPLRRNSFVALKIGELETSPLLVLEKKLSPYVVYLVLPIFVFTHMGIDLNHVSLDFFNSKLFWGIALGLFFGKQLGITGMSYLFIKLKWAHLPSRTNFLSLYGVSIICGVGFTMSLFIGSLAFANSAVNFEVTKLAIIISSLVAALLGYAWLFCSTTCNKGDA